MQMRILVVLVMAVALPWASAETEERGFLSKYNPFNGVVGRELEDEEVRGLRNFIATLNPFNGVVGRELTDEEVRGLGALIKKALPHVIKAVKVAAPYVMSGAATLINGREEEKIERGLGSFLKNKVLPVVKKVAPVVLTEGSKFLINRAKANGGREEEEERSFKSVLGKIGKVVKKVAPIALAAAPLLIGREEEEEIERGLGSFLKNKVLPVVKKVAPIVLTEGSKFLINRAKANGGREEEEERSFKSVLGKIGKVVKKVAPIDLAAAPLLVGREEEKEIERGIGSFLKNKVLPVVKKVAPVVLTEGSKFLINRAKANGGREEEEERIFKAFLGTAKGLAAGALSLVGREEEERSFKSFLGKVGKVVKKVAPIALAAAPLLVGREEEERSFKSVLGKIGKVVKKVAPIALAAAPLLVGRDE